MLISEINKWHWVISWDNPLPADSSGMLKALARLGNLTKLDTKTTVILAPRSTVRIARIRSVIVANLNGNTGNAFYVNLRTSNAFQYSKKNGYRWKIMNG